MAVETVERIRVLLIEDNPADARLIQEMLAEVPGLQFQLSGAGRLMEGLAQLADPSIDVVLLDLTLPDAQGLNTFEQLRARARPIPIVVLTGLDDETVAMRALRGGAQDYLVKGQVHGHWLAQSLRHAIERHGARGQRPRRGTTPAAGIRTERMGDTTAVYLSESSIVDPRTIERIGKALSELIDHDGLENLVVDLRSVKYLSNAAMAKLVELHKRMRDAGGRLRLHNVQSEVSRQFSMRRLNEVLEIGEDEPSAS